MINIGRLPKIDGTKKLIHKNQLLISLGIPALDLIIGGGLPTGNILLVEEDEFRVFSTIVLKHYLAEGIMNQHPLLLASLDVDCDSLVYDLPSPMNVPLGAFLDDEELSKMKGELRIAWRYGKPSSTNQTTDRNGQIFGHTFDLGSRGRVLSLVPSYKVDCWVEDFSGNDLESYNYDTLYDYIAKMLDNPKYNCNLPSENRTVLRIALVSLATGLWTGNLLAFLIKLRLLLRNYCATCFITMQPKLMENTKIMSRIEHLCDTVIELKSLLNEGNPTYEDYDGLVILKKLPNVNSWAPIIPETNDWAFKLRKNRFIVETLHISPELKVHDHRGDEEDGSRKMALCISEQF